MERGPRGAGVKTWTFCLFLGEAGAFGGSGRRRHGLPWLPRIAVAAVRSVDGGREG